MKITHLLASPFDSGPAETVVQLALAQRELGHDVLVACDQKRTDAQAESLLVPRLEKLQLHLKWGAQLSVKAGPFQLARDAAELKNLKSDITHCHFTHDHVLARLARREGLVRSIHKPRSLTWSTPKADGWTVPMSALLERIASPVKMVLPALVDAAFVPAANRTTLRSTLSLPLAGPLIGMVSTFQESRRHELGLAAFQRLLQSRPDAHLVLVGDGAREPEIRADVANRGLQKSVTFAGYQPEAAFIPWLQSCDEVWILGLGNDFAARAAAQARACDVRVVAVDEGALAEYADAIVAPTPEAIADAALGKRRATSQRKAAIQIAADVVALYTKALSQ